MKSTHKLTILITVLVLATLLCGFKSGVEIRDQIDDISYSITIEKDNYKIAKVKVAFIPKDSILYMNAGADQLPKRWATFIHNVEVTNKHGKAIKVEELPGAEWKMYTSLNEKVILTYDVHLDHEDHQWTGGIDGVAYTTELGVFYTGKTLLMLNGKEWKNIHVDFDLFKDWSVTTPWNKESDTNYAFKANSTSDLIDALIFAGTHKEVSLKRADFEVVFALGTEDMVAQEEAFRNLVEGVLDYYIELMGGIPNPRPDSPFNKAVVVISSYNVTDGEAIGNNISILIKKDADQFSKSISTFIFESPSSLKIPTFI